jgi:hypothetical protein
MVALRCVIAGVVGEERRIVEDKREVLLTSFDTLQRQTATAAGHMRWLCECYTSISMPIMTPLEVTPRARCNGAVTWE